MIGVTQHERGIDILEMFGRERLDGCLRANGREDRCEQVAVWRSEDTRAGAIVFGCDGKLEHMGYYNGRDWRLETRELLHTRRRLIVFRKALSHLMPCTSRSNEWRVHAQSELT